ncbi:MAG TPA: hypothetical protein VK869_00575 [Rubrobacteraceae bacterium]|nr:hypothetical protein [Rubrobacteraceae bacterium]
MSYWTDFGGWKERHLELVREAERERLARELGEARRRRELGLDGVEVRWGLVEDGTRIADLLELNGMPRWVAFEERYVVAELGGEVVAALRYRTEPGRLVLGLFVADPGVEERPLAVALYGRIRELALERGMREIRAWALPRGDYPKEVGYRRRGGEWRSDAVRDREVRGPRSVRGRLRDLVAAAGTLFMPFSRAFRG